MKRKLLSESIAPLKILTVPVVAEGLQMFNDLNHLEHAIWPRERALLR